jgi:hypothetical protein
MPTYGRLNRRGGYGTRRELVDRDDRDGALQDGYGIGVASEAVVDGGGDVEAHDEVKLRAVAVVLKRAGGPLIHCVTSITRCRTPPVR